MRDRLDSGPLTEMENFQIAREIRLLGEERSIDVIQGLLTYLARFSKKHPTTFSGVMRLEKKNRDIREATDLMIRLQEIVRKTRSGEHFDD